VREGTTIEDPLLLLLLRLCVEEAKQQGVLLPGGPSEFQRLFNGLLKALGLGLVGFTPSSLRRGGATSLMARCGDLKVLTVIGRWGNVATARLYVDGAAQDRTAIQFTAVQHRRCPTSVIPDDGVTRWHLRLSWRHLYARAAVPQPGDPDHPLGGDTSAWWS